MANIFKEAIVKNYEYIMICDDDILISDNLNFTIFNLYKKNGKFRIINVGSSQWDWDNININEITTYLMNHQMDLFVIFIIEVHLIVFMIKF